MLKCFNCKENLPDKTNYCLNCGTKINHSGNTETFAYTDNLKNFSLDESETVLTSRKKATAKNHYMVMLIAVLLLVGMGLLAFSPSINFSSHSVLPSSNRMADPNTISVGMPPEGYHQTIKETPSVPVIEYDDKMAIDARGYGWVNINLETQSKLTGRVEARGGSNDIDTIVMDEDEFVNFQNTNSFRRYYRSGYVTIGKFDLTLSAGSYYVIFSNQQALLTNKIVKAKISSVALGSN